MHDSQRGDKTSEQPSKTRMFRTGAVRPVTGFINVKSDITAGLKAESIDMPAIKADSVDLPFRR